MSTRRAFVIQFRPDADLQQKRWEGRLEHISSGHVMHFHSLQELLGFLCEMMQQENTEPLQADAGGLDQSQS